MRKTITWEVANLSLQPDIDKIVYEGAKVYRYYGPDNRHNGWLHIVAIVDDIYVVCRRWRGGGWHYFLEDAFYFYVQRTHLSKEKPSD
jgi:hypothetical protein